MAVQFGVKWIPIKKGVNTSEFADKVDLMSPKSDVYKLKTLHVDCKKLGDVVENYIKKHCIMNKFRKLHRLRFLVQWHLLINHSMILINKS